MLLDTKRIAMATALALLATGSWWLSRSVSVPFVPFDGKTRHDPDYTIENFNATIMDAQGQRRYSLAAQLLIHYGDDGSSALDKPYLVQYQEGGAPVNTRADKGWMPKDGSEILMSGNVRVAQGRDPRSVGGLASADNMKILLDKPSNETR